MSVIQIVEIIATLFGLVSVWLTVKQSLWCWPTGLVMVSLYVFIFFDARLYSDMGLHVIYIFVQFYGWYHWRYGGGDHSPLRVTTLTNSARMSWVAIAILSTLGLGFLVDTHTDADLAYWDATTTSLSLIAQWLMARKILENWVLWITVDILAVGIYFVKGLYVTSALYAVFLVMASMGLIAWRRSMTAIHA